MAELTMPRLSDTMEEGTLARWVKQPGDQIARGDVVAEIETDKATMELEAYEAGVLQEHLVQEGQTVPIGTPIARLGDGAGAAGAAAEAQPAQQQAPAQPRPATEAETPRATEPAAPQPATEAEAPRPSPEPAGAPEPAPEPRPAPEPPPAPEARPAPEQRPAPEAPPPGDAVKASPMARAIARDRGLDLAEIQGSGPGGRVVRADVEAALAEAPPARPAPAPPAERREAPPAAEEAEEAEAVPLSAMRRTVARRMLESIQSAPHFFLTSLVDAEALADLRTELNERLERAGDPTRLSLNDLLIKACASALRANPDVNVSFGGDHLLRHRRVHIGIAVALEQGLIVPVLRDADQKSLGQIAREAAALAERARSSKLSPAEYSGGTFTISNLGMFGVDHFTAIINPPEAAILAVGALTPEPVARDGRVEVRRRLKLTLSIDHRALDGATAARFLRDLKGLLEEPLRLVV